MFWSDKYAKNNKQWKVKTLSIFCSAFLNCIGCYRLLILNNCSLPCSCLMWVTDDVWATGKFIFGIKMFFFIPRFYLSLFVYSYILYRFQFFCIYICVYIYIYIRKKSWRWNLRLKYSLLERMCSRVNKVLTTLK